MDGKANHNRKEAHAWEEFYLYDGGDGSMTIMNPEHMTYLRADPNSNIIRCDETDYTKATKFIGWKAPADETPAAPEPVLKPSSPFDAKAGDVLASLPRYFRTMFTGRHQKHGWGVWEKSDSDRVVFKNKETRKVLVAKDNMKLYDDSGVFGPWEKFTIG